MNPVLSLAETAAPAFDPGSLTPDNPVVRWWFAWAAAGFLVDAVLASGWGRSAWRRAVRVPPPTWPPRETGMLSLLILTLSLAAGVCAWVGSGALAEGARIDESVALLCHALLVQVAGGCVILARLRLYGSGPVRLLCGPSCSPLRGAGTALVLLLGISPLIDLAQVGFPALLERLGWDLEPQALPLQFLSAESPWTLGLIAVVALTLAPLFEELLFRGLLYRSLRPLVGPVPAALAAAGLFAWTHGNLSVFPGLLLLGLGLTLAYELTGSLAAAILMHAGFNLRSLLIMIALRGSVA